MENIDYTKMRLGKVIARWTYQTRAGVEKQGKQQITKCPSCGKNAIRSMTFGITNFLHKVTYTSQLDGIFVTATNKEQCVIKATEADKVEYDGHYCATVGCWREAGKDSEGLCSNHRNGPSGGEIRRAVQVLLDSERLNEAQFTEMLDKLRLKVKVV